MPKKAQYIYRHVDEAIVLTHWLVKVAKNLIKLARPFIMISAAQNPNQPTNSSSPQQNVTQ